ncbi:MAG: hypothetical protein GY820_48360 [Gammaproteobacteria bacterium]|nr:hypothetical protein [Gammaproteobacteria bacterium]
MITITLPEWFVGVLVAWVVLEVINTVLQIRMRYLSWRLGRMNRDY